MVLKIIYRGLPNYDNSGPHNNPINDIPNYHYWIADTGQINSKQYLWSLKHNLCYNSL